MRTLLLTCVALASLGVALACHSGPDTTAPTGTGVVDTTAPTGTGGDAPKIAPASTATDAGSAGSTGSTGAVPSASTVASGSCKASSVVTTAQCARRVIPPSNATSSRGCKSDAECKQGIDGRCVQNPYFRAELGPPQRETHNLLAGPPPLPLQTICVYDQCNTNTECGAHARCACGEGPGRNTCVVLDSCLADADCGKDSLCACGAKGSPNGCAPGNCRTDKDCGSAGCGFGLSGAYCRTSRDQCRSDKDCASPTDFRRCDFDRASRVWACRVIPPQPPG